MSQPMIRVRFIQNIIVDEGGKVTSYGILETFNHKRRYETDIISINDALILACRINTYSIDVDFNNSHKRYVTLKSKTTAVQYVLFEDRIYNII
jgi:hypothetical protein